MDQSRSGEASRAVPVVPSQPFRPLSTHLLTRGMHPPFLRVAGECIVESHQPLRHSGGGLHAGDGAASSSRGPPKALRIVFVPARGATQTCVSVCVDGETPLF